MNWSYEISLDNMGTRQNVEEALKVLEEALLDQMSRMTFPVSISSARGWKLSVSLTVHSPKPPKTQLGLDEYLWFLLGPTDKSGS